MVGRNVRIFRRGYRTLRDGGVGRIASALAAFRVAFGPESGEADKGWPQPEDWPE